MDKLDEMDRRGKKEWKGPWSDGSAEWKALSASERQSIGLDSADDGEFWMSFDDFCDNFTTLNICRLVWLVG